jgi:hypothetical protein
MTKLEIAKLAINVAAGLGVAKVTNDIITMNTTADTNGDKVKVAIGSIVIGSIVSDVASNHINAKINAIANYWQNRKIVKTPVEMTGNLNETAA